MNMNIVRKAVHENNINLFKSLIEDPNININEKFVDILDEGGLLHLTVIFQNYEMIKLLLEKGANVNIQNKFGGTPLMHCHSNKILKLLIKYGADVNHVSKTNVTALYLACLDRDLEKIKILLKYGANLDYNMYTKQTIFDVIKYYREKGFNIMNEVIDVIYNFMWIKELYNLWILEEIKFYHFIQWLPRELLEDQNVLIKI